MSLLLLKILLPTLVLLTSFAINRSARAGVTDFFKEGKTHVQAHRGASAEFEENTLPAFRRAIEIGADSFELDLHVTKDGEVVIFHDFSLDSHAIEGETTGGAINTLTLEQIKSLRLKKTKRMKVARELTPDEKITPTLEEIFKLVAGSASPNARKIRIDLEIKSEAAHPELSPPPEEFAKLVLAKVNASSLKDQIVIRSFDHRVLKAVHALDPSMPLIALTEGPFDYLKLTLEFGQHGLLAIAPEFEHVTREDVVALHAIGVKVIPWTVNGPKMYQAALDKGVDGITTDHPVELQRFLRRKFAAAKSKSSEALRKPVK